MKERIVESISMEEAFRALNEKPRKSLYESKLNEGIDKNAVMEICDKIRGVYGGIMLDKRAADKILKSCGEEPTGKAATFDDVLAIAQDVISAAPLGAGALMGIVEAILEALMTLITAGAIVIPVDGPALDVICGVILGFMKLIPSGAIIAAVVALPAAVANRILLAIRKNLRRAEADKFDKELSAAGVNVEELEESLVLDTLRGAAKGALGIGEDLKMQESLILDTIRGAAQGFLGEDLDDSDQKLISDLLEVIESALYDFFNGQSDEDDVEESLVGDTIRGAARGALGLD